ncbi:hypothetical protein K438DRAFT_1774048 [Mycena galopus ATCC 62051]|nr:hypothetical protein K438DRAFT_1774048 [Mycena galopus ATCC 62051]
MGWIHVPSSSNSEDVPAQEPHKAARRPCSSRTPKGKLVLNYDLDDADGDPNESPSESDKGEPEVDLPEINNIKSGLKPGLDENGNIVAFPGISDVTAICSSSVLEACFKSDTDSTAKLHAAVNKLIGDLNNIDANLLQRHKQGHITNFNSDCTAHGRMETLEHPTILPLLHPMAQPYISIFLRLYSLPDSSSPSGS